MFLTIDETLFWAKHDIQNKSASYRLFAANIKLRIRQDGF